MRNCLGRNEAQAASASFHPLCPRASPIAKEGRSWLESSPLPIKKAVWAKPLPLLISPLHWRSWKNASCSWIAIRRQTPPAGSASVRMCCRPICTRRSSSPKRLTRPFYPRFRRICSSCPPVRIWRRLNWSLWIRWGGNSIFPNCWSRWKSVLISLSWIALRRSACSRSTPCAPPRRSLYRSSASSLPWKASSSCCKPMNRSRSGSILSWGFSAWC